MQFIYNSIIVITSLLLKVVALFNPKLKSFVAGRKTTFKTIRNKIKKEDVVIWMHCASLGEFEQGRPVLEQLKKEYPAKKIVLTFFSPSGFEVRKNYELADVVCYLPLDSNKNVTKFLKWVHPEAAIFVKYEFWPNYLRQLKKQQISTILISGIFRKNQVFFKWYGSWMRNALKTFHHFFVQDIQSKNLLNSIHLNNVTVSGDTRFDRVYEITGQNNTLPFVEAFKNNQMLLVAGSTWKDDELLLVDYINNHAASNQRFIIAPHNIHKNEIEALKKAINKPTIVFSEECLNNTYDTQKLKKASVFIVDTIGLLTKIYSYATIAYVGGGFTKSGVHNVLEPATFGIPILIGPRFSKFKEVKDLVALKACISVNNSEKLSVNLMKFFQQETLRKQKGKLALDYVVLKKGATNKIINYFKDERKIR